MDNDNITDCITDHIRFCEDTKMPAFPNNKPWVTSDLKALLNKKERTFRSGTREQQRRVHHELGEMLRSGKETYRRKLGAKLPVISQLELNKVNLSI